MSPQKPQAENKSKARIKGIGSDVRLTQCPRCKRFADKYVEHDFVVLFIDLVLVKPQVSEFRTGDAWMEMVWRGRHVCLALES